MAFDFFNISGSLFVETQCDPSIRASSQGLFMMMTNGIGSIIGSLASGFIISEFFMDGENKIWSDIWLTFALYALAVTVLFALLFRHKHNAKDFENFSH